MIRHVREIDIPLDAKRIEEFQFVKVFDGHQWRPALLVAWIRIPDGWACWLRTPMHMAVNGRVTHVQTVLYDPELVRRLTVDDLNPPDGGQPGPGTGKPA